MNARPGSVLAALFTSIVSLRTEPTAEETAVLCLVNRFRQDPQTFRRLVVDSSKPENAAHVNWAKFAAEIVELKPAPRHFFERYVIDAPRAHARYMIEAEETAIMKQRAYLTKPDDSDAAFEVRIEG